MDINQITASVSSLVQISASVKIGRLDLPGLEIRDNLSRSCTCFEISVMSKNELSDKGREPVFMYQTEGRVSVKAQSFMN